MGGSARQHQDVLMASSSKIRGELPVTPSLCRDVLARVDPQASVFALDAMILRGFGQKLPEYRLRHQDPQVSSPEERREALAEMLPKVRRLCRSAAERLIAESAKTKNSAILKPVTVEEFMRNLISSSGACRPSWLWGAKRTGLAGPDRGHLKEVAEQTGLPLERKRIRNGGKNLQQELCAEEGGKHKLEEAYSASQFGDASPFSPSLSLLGKKENNDLDEETSTNHLGAELVQMGIGYVALPLSFLLTEPLPSDFDDDQTGLA